MKSAIAGTLLACCAALSASGQADIDSPARSKVTALEQVWARALSNGDLKALDALSDPGIIFVDSDGTLMNKSEVLSYAKSPHPVRVIGSITKVQAFDDTVVVNGTYHWKELKNGRPEEQEEEFTHTWLYKDSNWVCIVAQATPILGPTK